MKNLKSFNKISFGQYTQVVKGNNEIHVVNEKDIEIINKMLLKSEYITKTNNNIIVVESELHKYEFTYYKGFIILDSRLNYHASCFKQEQSFHRKDVKNHE